jgi:hypothetical protein
MTQHFRHKMLFMTNFVLNITLYFYHTKPFFVVHGPSPAALPARAPSPRRAPPRARPPWPRLAPPRPLPGGPPLPAPPTPRLAPSHRGLPPRASAARPGRVPPCLGHAPPAVLPVRARAPATHAPRVCTARVPSARATRSRACVRGRTALNLVLIHFNCCSVNMLHRALRRATNLSNFRFY